MLTTRQSVQEFRPLLHDGQVGPKVRVKYLVKSNQFESGDHFPSDPTPDGPSKLLAEGHPDGRCRLGNHHLRRIRDGIPDVVNVLALRQRADRTRHNTLTAINAYRIGERLPKRWPHHGFKASFI